MKMILGRNSTCVDDSFNELMVELKNWFKEIFKKRGMPHLLKASSDIFPSIYFLNLEISITCKVSP